MGEKHKHIIKDRYYVSYATSKGSPLKLNIVREFESLSEAENFVNYIRSADKKENKTREIEVFK